MELQKREKRKLDIKNLILEAAGNTMNWQRVPNYIPPAHFINFYILENAKTKK